MRFDSCLHSDLEGKRVDWLDEIHVVIDRLLEKDLFDLDKLVDTMKIKKGARLRKIVGNTVQEWKYNVNGWETDVNLSNWSKLNDKLIMLE